MLEARGGSPVALRNAVQDLEDTLIRNQEQWDTNKARSEQLVNELYPGPKGEQMRNLTLNSVNGFAKMSSKDDSEAMSELVRISDQQSRNLDYNNALALPFAVARNVLERDRIGLLNTREAWDQLFEPLRPDLENLRRAYVEMGLELNTQEEKLGAPKLPRPQRRELYEYLPTETIVDGLREHPSRLDDNAALISKTRAVFRPFLVVLSRRGREGLREEKSALQQERAELNATLADERRPPGHAAGASRLESR